MIHEVEVPGGKVLKIEGPEDASDEELIGIAKQHLSAQKAPKTAAEPPAAKAPSGSVPPNEQLKVSELPAMSTPDQLLKDMIFVVAFDALWPMCFPMGDCHHGQHIPHD